ncbi:MAG TPA: MFS transporter [Fibrobacteria bacterium]|nr:MFS transporter [Fibrobacteria bacterium]
MHEDSTATRAPGPSSPAPYAEEATLGGIPVGSPAARRALIHSFFDGLLANGMVALQETFAIAAAVSLHASAMAIALMSSLPMLFGSLAQFLLPAVAGPSKGRKHYVLLGVRMQALFLFACAFTGFLPASVAPWVYAATFVMAGVSGNAIGGFWTSWMGDLIPGEVRGRHFAWRNAWLAWMYLACSLAAGTLAREYTSRSAPWTLFACVFACAALLRAGSWFFLSRQWEPEPVHARETFNLFRFRPHGDFLMYCLATSAFTGAAAMSGPFFSVWYLRDLHYDYLTVAIALSATVLGSIAGLPLWGRLCDTIGTSRTLRISGLLVCFIPIPFLFASAPHWIWLINVYSGATWAGYNLANFNHLLSATESRQRTHYIAFAALIGGVMGFAFTMVGGFLSTRLPPLNGYGLRSLFLLSVVIRLSVCLVFFNGIREYRQTLPSAGSLDLFNAIPGYRVGLGLARNAFRALRGGD